MHATDDYKELKLKLDGMVPAGLDSIATCCSMRCMPRCRATLR